MSLPGSRPPSAPPSCPCSPTCHERCCLRSRGDVPLTPTPSDGISVGASASSSPASPTSSSPASSSASSSASSAYGSTDTYRPLSKTLNASGNGKSSLEESLRCLCHDKPKSDPGAKRARNKLIIACLMALAFMIAEIVGGYLSHSLAILTDAAHMLSDFASFLISLFAIWIGTRPPSKKFNFGWHRAEVVGAVVSVLIIWVLTGVLVYEAVLRCIHQNFEIDADVMLITACGGVFLNVFMMAVLGHSHGGHGHSHGGGGHGHSHGGGGSDEQNRKKEQAEDGSEEQGLLASQRKGKGRKGHRKSKVEHQNINVRAAFIHVIGDLIQSIGVVLAGYIIWIKPEWKLADPICTFLFSILVLFSTINVLRDALRVLMEGTPKHIDYVELKQDLTTISGVKRAHNVNIWSLTMNKTAAAAHLVLEEGASPRDVLQQASQLLKEKYGVHQSTLQLEDYAELMDTCTHCSRV